MGDSIWVMLIECDYQLYVDPKNYCWSREHDGILQTDMRAMVMTYVFDYVTIFVVWRVQMYETNNNTPMITQLWKFTYKTTTL